jgi:MFS family permease
MDAEFTKSVLPVVGGALALAGGIFTFVSGRLRDAEGRDAKDRIMQLCFLWIACVLWIAGSALCAVSGAQIYAVPLYVISFALHWKLFSEGPNPPSRNAVANFALLAAMTAFSIVFAMMISLIDPILRIQERTIQVLERTVGSSKLPTK